MIYVADIGLLDESFNFPTLIAGNPKLRRTASWRTGAAESELES
jgi:hypothetical protein